MTTTSPLPDLDLRPGVVTVFRQSLPDCAVYPPLATFQFLRRKLGLETWLPSARFLYHHLSLVKLTVSTNLKLCVQTLRKFGLPPDDWWPSDPTLPIKTYVTKPPPEVFTTARINRCVCKKVERKMKPLRSALVNLSPVMFTFDVPADFGSDDEIARTGFFRWKTIKPPLARHAGVLVGLSDTDRIATVLNSFGTKWGKGGYFNLPYDYLLSRHCRDFWIIQSLVGAGRVNTNNRVNGSAAKA